MRIGRNPDDAFFARRGFTLIETLLAISLVLVVFMAVYSLFGAVTRTLEGQEARKKGSSAVHHFLSDISRDLISSAPAGEEGTCDYRLIPSETGKGVTLAFCTAIPAEAEKDRKWFEYHHVSYVLRSELGKGTRLERENRPRTGPDSLWTRTNLLLKAVQLFQVEFFDGARWHATWPPGDEPATPEAARVKVEIGERKVRSYETEVIIPVGQVFSPDEDGTGVGG